MGSTSKYDKFKDVFLMEQHRIDSFQKWPFDEKSSCSISKMAEAGFYWSGNERENDTVTCFVCAKTLDGWEATDNPWKEHAKHAPQCVFVKYRQREKDLTVQEFLNVSGAVLKNKMTQNLNRKKRELRKVACGELEAFLAKN